MNRQVTGCLAVIALVMFGVAAHAQEWPTKPVKMIVPLPAGTAPDITMRLMGDRLSKLWGQQVVVENRPGASGAIGMQAVARAAADGYTFVFSSAFVFTLTPHLMKTPGFDLDRDFVPVARVAGTPMLLAANPQFAANNLSDVIQLAKSQADKINVSNPQYASIPHLFVEMLNQQTGIRLYNVPFSGTTPAMTAAINGDVQLVVDGIAPLLPYVRSGRLKAIAMAAPQPLAGLDGIPLANATIPGFNIMGWFGILARKGTSDVVIQRVNADVNKALAVPEITDRLREIGTYPMPGTVKEFAAFLGEERSRWAKAVKDAGIEAQ